MHHHPCGSLNTLLTTAPLLDRACPSPPHLPAGNAIRAHQELARTEEDKLGGTSGSGEDEKLANVYFTYSTLEDAYADKAAGKVSGARPGSALKRPGSALKVRGLELGGAGREGLRGA